MSLFKRKPNKDFWQEVDERAKALVTPTRESLRETARDIAEKGWGAKYPGDNFDLLLIGELQTQIDELKEQIR